MPILPNRFHQRSILALTLGLVLLPTIAAAWPGDYETGRAPALRAVWVDVFHEGYKSTTQINSLVSRALDGNYNAIFAEVLAYHDRGTSGHGAYWNSTIVPQATDISGGLDPLAYLVSRAHTYGIEVHAWIVPYRACTSWPPAYNTLLAAHPEWLMVPIADMGGGPATVDGKYILDPGSPGVQDYVVSIVRELVTDYEIDGINLDYIRYTQVDAGYPADEDYEKSSLRRFQDLTWYNGTPPPTGETSWNDFRRRTIDELVRRLHAEIPAITSNPSQPLRFTADLFASGGAPANFTNSDAYYLHQNWRYWMEQGWLDASMPMNYKREWDPPQDSWYRSWIDAAVGWRYGHHVFCGQANYLNPMADSITQLQYCLDAGADGTCNYSYVGTADENMDGNWENNWSWYTYVANNLFTSAVPTPTMPWRDPVTATEGTLWGRVTDPDTDEPIDGALVEVGELDGVWTDGNGYYAVSRIAAASGGSAYDVSVYVIDCPTVELAGVVVMPGTVTREDIFACSDWVPGDMNEDGHIDQDDLPYVYFCLGGPDDTYAEGHFCLNGDADGDFDMDMADFASFQILFNSQK